MYKIVCRAVVMGLILMGYALTINAQSKNEEEIWAEAVLDKLSLDQKIGQLFLITAHTLGDEEQWEDLLEAVEDVGPGGVVFAHGDPYSQLIYTNQIQEKARVPMLVAMDLSEGLSRWLVGVTPFPNTLTLGAIQDAGSLEKLGKVLGQQMKIMGIHVHLWDLDSYFESQQKEAFIKGLKKAGGLVFTHPKNLSHDPDGLLLNRLWFAEGISDEQVESAGPLVSATVYSQPGQGPGSAEWDLFEKGVELQFFPEDLRGTVSFFRKKLRKSKAGRQQLDSTVKKILMAKYRAGLGADAPLNSENLIMRLEPPEWNAAVEEAYEKSITILRNDDDLLPIKTLDNINFASLVVAGPQGDALRDHLSRFTFFTHYIPDSDRELSETLGLYDVVVAALPGSLKQEDPAQWQALTRLIRSIAGRTSVILIHYGITEDLENISQLTATVITYEDHPSALLYTAEVIFGAVEASATLPLQTIGFEKGSGIKTESLKRLSFAQPERMGLSSAVLKNIDLIAEEAILEMATPGMQVLVARHGRVVFDQSYGYYTYDSLRPVTHKTIYDLASITKVAATLQAIMFLEERGLIDLDHKASLYLPELKKTNKKDIILRDILTHQAGLWPYLPFWLRTMDQNIHDAEFYRIHPENPFNLEVGPGLYSHQATRDSVMQWVMESQMRKKIPGEPYDYRYSDMGFYILQAIAEKIIGQPMEVFLTQNLYEPLGLGSLGFLPLCRFSHELIAPTEDDQLFRLTSIIGTVHDQGAALVGGVAGHAGLFGNAHDLAKLMQMHLQGGYYGGLSFYEPETIEHFSKKYYKKNRRAIGWDKPSPGDSKSPTSRFASQATFGHTGFTGTAFWADPEFGLIYVFLSNRIHPDASNRELIRKNIRTRIQDIVYEAMWDVEQYRQP